MFASVLLSLSLAAGGLPAYLRALPWSCEASAPGQVNGMRLAHLSRCTPQGRPKLEAFVQRVADAMGNAGHPPRLRFGPQGPHLVSLDGAGAVSVSFVRDESGRFDAWVAVQELAASSALPVLPAGVSVLADHEEDSGKRMLSLRLEAPSREAGAVLQNTLHALGAQALGATATSVARDGISGRLLWGQRPGFYHLTDGGPDGGSFLTLYSEPLAPEAKTK